MATSQSTLCKTIEDDLRALLMPDRGKSADPQKHHDLPHAEKGSSEEKPNYENDFPVLGADPQSLKGSAKLKPGQNKNKKKKSGKKKKPREPASGQSKSDHKLDIELITSHNPVQSILSNKTKLIDLRENPVLPPENVQILDEPLVKETMEVQHEVPFIDSLSNRRFVDVSAQSQKQEVTGARKPALLKTPDDMGGRDAFPNNFRSKKQNFNSREVNRMPDDPRKLAKIANLEEEFINFLKKPSQRYPGAQLFCKLCGYHCNFDNVDRHVAAKNHKSAVEGRRTEIFLMSLPFPSPLQVEAVTKVVTEIAEEVGLSQDDTEIRQSLMVRLNQLVESHIPGCRLKLFGSSITGFGLKGSDVNIDVLLPCGKTPPVVLSELYQIFKERDDLDNVQSEFDAKLPRISFTDKETELFCIVSWNNVQATQTSKLLSDYNSLDPRAKVLGTVFRHWAKLCGIDCQEKGTLPAHTFALLVVYFLQQHKPAVLPVLHELQQSNDIEKYLDPSDVVNKWKTYNEESVGELWLNLLRFYCIDFLVSKFVVCLRRRKPVLRNEKNWTGKVIAIEDPYCRKRNLTRSISSQIVYRHIQERLYDTYKYFGVPQLKTGPLFTALPKQLLNANGRYRVGQEDRSAIKEYEDYHSVEQEKNDVATSKVVVENNADCSDDDEDDIIEEKIGDQERKKKFAFHNDSSSDGEGFEDQDPDLSVDEVVSRISNMNLGMLRRKSERTESESSEVFDAAGSGDSMENEKEATKEVACDISVASVYVVEVKNLMSSFTKEELAYDFDKDVFTGGKLPPIYCSLCSKEGHLKQKCPDEILPDLVPLPPMTDEFLHYLDLVCEYIMSMHAPSEDELQRRKVLLNKLTTVIKETYPDAKLDLYGSSCNGFGFTGSDLDVCVTLEDKPSDGLDFAEMISNLAGNFAKHKDFTNILAITTAKVPIVKVTDKATDIECDISFYNTLAQHNTRMLRVYSEIDKRAQVLGYVMKYFAKLCEIGDASRGSLSSYAFILMVLHFLQQRDPPVLPVLQELYDLSGDPPEVIVEGWNAWFYDDLDNLDSVWTERNKNKESVGELWLGLLQFYTDEFKRKENVVCIRKKDPLTRFEKMWHSKSFAIEDPLDLNHNLGSGVSCKMHTFIMKALINGRRIFGTPFDIIPVPKAHVALMDFLFDPDKLKDGQPPNDRGCRWCHKIGHKVKDCPQKKKNGENRNQKQDGRQMSRQRPNWHQNPKFKDRVLPTTPPRGDRPSHLGYSPQSFRDASNIDSRHTPKNRFNNRPNSAGFPQSHVGPSTISLHSVHQRNSLLSSPAWGQQRNFSDRDRNFRGYTERDLDRDLKLRGDTDRVRDRDWTFKKYGDRMNDADGTREIDRNFRDDTDRNFRRDVDKVRETDRFFKGDTDRIRDRDSNFRVYPDRDLNRDRVRDRDWTFKKYGDRRNDADRTHETGQNFRKDDPYRNFRRDDPDRNFRRDATDRNFRRDTDKMRDTDRYFRRDTDRMRANIDQNFRGGMDRNFRRDSDLDMQLPRSAGSPPYFNHVLMSTMAGSALQAEQLERSPLQQQCIQLSQGQPIVQSGFLLEQLQPGNFCRPPAPPPFSQSPR